MTRRGSSEAAISPLHDLGVSARWTASTGDCFSSAYNGGNKVALRKALVLRKADSSDANCP